jgi:hypothetical protein
VTFYLLLRRHRRAFSTSSVPATALTIGGVPLTIGGDYLTIGA